MSEFYTMKIAGLERNLKLCPVSDSLDIAAFILFGDVEVTIVNDGAVITSIELHYFLAANEAANLVESEMTVKVVYTYDLERITIE